ncbi:hypothetical protein CHN51_12955 [Sphingorhabdus sp. YGSMI21]|nr:hypothetical protein CHN51_12955 [Sphingorhabdus sp. YGSMI21]
MDVAIQKIVLVCLLLMIPIFILSGVYNAIFRYAGTGMMKTLVRAFASYSVLTAFAFAFAGMDGVPRTIGLIQPVVFFILVGFSRVAGRYLMVDILGRNRFAGEVRNVLIYGAGSAGQQLAASMRSEPLSHWCRNLIMAGIMTTISKRRPERSPANPGKPLLLRSKFQIGNNPNGTILFCA